MKKLILNGIMCISILLLASCNQSPQSKIVGEWIGIEIDNQNDYIFNSDLTFFNFTKSVVPFMEAYKCDNPICTLIHYRKGGYQEEEDTISGTWELLGDTNKLQYLYPYKIIIRDIINHEMREGTVTLFSDNEIQLEYNFSTKLNLKRKSNN